MKKKVAKTKRNQRKSPTKEMLEKGKPFIEREFYKDINKNTISDRTPYGFCHFKHHKGFLSRKQVLSHQCFDKNCPLLTLNLSHPLNKDYCKKKGVII